MQNSSPSPARALATDTFYAESARRLAAVNATIAPDAWGRPSPCSGWSAADVVVHLIGTQSEFLKSHHLTPGDPPDVLANPGAAWTTHASAVEALLAQPGLAEREIDGFFGPTTVGATMTRFYGFDMIVHRWDIARAAGVDPSLAVFSEAEMDQIEGSIDGFGDHLYGEGVCGPAVSLEPSSSRQDLLLARMGRDPRLPM